MNELLPPQTDTSIEVFDADNTAFQVVQSFLGLDGAALSILRKQFTIEEEFNILIDMIRQYQADPEAARGAIRDLHRILRDLAKLNGMIQTEQVRMSGKNKQGQDMEAVASRDRLISQLQRKNTNVLSALTPFQVRVPLADSPPTPDQPEPAANLDKQ